MCQDIGDHYKVPVYQYVLIDLRLSVDFISIFMCLLLGAHFWFFIQQMKDKQKDWEGKKNYKRIMKMLQMVVNKCK